MRKYEREKKTHESNKKKHIVSALFFSHSPLYSPANAIPWSASKGKMAAGPEFVVVIPDYWKRE